jgi:hypothetical protein
MSATISAKERLKYGREITVESNEMNFWGQLKKADKNAIIQTELQTDNEPNGAKVRIYFNDKVKGAGIRGNTDHEDNRGTQAELYQDVTYSLFGNSLKSKKIKLENKLATAGFREKAATGLKNWVAEREDRIITAKVSANCTNIVACKNGGVYDKNNTSDIQEGDIFSTRAIKEAKRRARNGLDGDGKSHPPMRPFRKMVKNAGGIIVPVNYYIMVIGMYAADQLDLDPLWLEAQKMAAARKVAELDIISGYKGIYDGVIIVERENWNSELSGVVTSETADFEDYAGDFGIYAGKNGIETEVNIFLGASALLMPMDEGFEYREPMDEENKKMICLIERGLGIEKTRFVGETTQEKKSIYHNKDFGAMAIVNSIK